MRYARSLLGWAGVLVLGLNVTTANAQNTNQEELGCVGIDRKFVDYDVIKNARPRANYRAIQLSVFGSDADILSVKVVYGNGEMQDVSVRQRFEAGSKSRVIDLPGVDRHIDRIIVVSQGAQRGRGPGSRPHVCVSGFLKGFAPPQGKRVVWDELGCSKVGFLVDRDVINISRREGRFDAVRLEVKGNDIFFYDLRIVYGNGQADNIPIRLGIPAGGSTRVIDLKGADRFISRVEMVYGKRLGFPQSARVCVYGRQAS